ncbi:MAG: type II/IV secretion system protein, partial [Pirellulaceae bacterium]|nr:type II/IV secretion system protein [Pirellulaceae bacterium]
MVAGASYIDLLIQQGTISQDQANEAEQVSRDTDTPIQDAVIKLGYATGEEVAKVIASSQHYDYIDLRKIKVPEQVIE